MSLELRSSGVFVNTNFWGNSASAASLMEVVDALGIRTQSLSSYGNGGSMAVTTAQSLWLVNVSLSHNYADSLGGALFLLNSKLSHIVNCTYDHIGVHYSSCGCIFFTRSVFWLIYCIQF